MVSGVRPKRGPYWRAKIGMATWRIRARDLRRDCYAAVDIGASSGRVVVGFVEDGRIHLEEVHRFDNRQVRRGGHDCWDIDLLYGELVRGPCPVQGGGVRAEIRRHRHLGRRFRPAGC